MPYAPTLTTLRLDAALVAERQADEEKRLARELDVRRELREKDAAFARDLELRRLQREAGAATTAAATARLVRSASLTGLSPRATLWQAELELDSSRRAAARRKASLDAELAVAETKRAVDAAHDRALLAARARSLSPVRHYYPAASAAVATAESARLRAELAQPLYSTPYSSNAALRALDAARAEELAQARSRVEWELALGPRSSWVSRLY